MPMPMRMHMHVRTAPEGTKVTIVMAMPMRMRTCVRTAPGGTSMLPRPRSSTTRERMRCHPSPSRSLSSKGTTLSRATWYQALVCSEY